MKTIITKLTSLFSGIKNYLTIIKLSIFAGLIIAVWSLARSNSSLRRNTVRNERNVEVLTDSLHRSLLHDSLPTVSSGVITLTKKQFKETQKKTVRTAKDLGIKAKDVTTVADVSIKTEDKIKYVLKDSVFDYKDKWATFHASTKDTIFDYSVRDSLSMLVNRIYKHKFLWWKWGTKGYDITVTNFNPKSSVEYLRYIEVKK